MSDKAKAIKEFYDSLGVAKVNKKHLENETLHKLYKLPKKDKKGEIVHWDCYKKMQFIKPIYYFYQMITDINIV